MTTIAPTLIETLLNMSESDVLDFKRDQYALTGATDDQKSELVKDILAFSNAWKTDDAHIFIGADENSGGRATVTGVVKQLNDADIQQLVNTKTNVPVAFEYVPLTVEGKHVAVIRIKKDQQRPVFLRKPFGRLKPSVVYVRRGSSTAEAAPDEIARMGAATVVAREAPLLEVELAEPEERKRLGGATKLTSKLLVERPPPDPGLLEVQAGIASQFALAKRLQGLGRQFDVDKFGSPRPDREKVVRYKKELGVLQRLGFYVRNAGQVLVEDTRVVLEVPKGDGLKVVDGLPEKPRGPMDFPVPPLRSFTRPARTTRVKDLGASWEVVARFDKIQPSATAWSKPFWIGSEKARELPLVARVYGDNIPQMLEVPVLITLEVAEGYFDLEDDDGEDVDDVP